MIRELSHYLASFLLSNTDELIINCEAFFREIENKENEILNFLQTIFYPPANASSNNFPITEEDKDSLTELDKTMQNKENSFIGSSFFKKSQTFNQENQEKNSENSNFLKKGVTLNLEAEKSPTPIKMPILSTSFSYLDPVETETQEKNVFVLIRSMKKVFNSLQYSFSQFGRVIHYINIANSLQKPLKYHNNEYGSNSMPLSSEDPYVNEDELEEEEKLIKELIITEKQKKKVLKVNIPLTFLAFSELSRSLAEEKNLILLSKKKRSLEVYLKWKLKKWDNSEKPKAKPIYGIPCRICLNKVWSNKLASHSKLCLQKSQISNDLENHRKTMLKFIEMAIENKRNSEIQRILEK